jgi:hypothetical protein
VTLISASRRYVGEFDLHQLDSLTHTYSRDVRVYIFNDQILIAK